jgi:predicted MFS family arabinose efflux permease
MERTCLYAYLAMLLGVLPLVFSLSPVVLVATGFSFGAGFGVTFPAFILLLVQRLDTASRGTSLGILIASGDIAIALSVLIMGGIAEHFGYVYLFLAVTVTLAVCMYFLYALIFTKTVRPGSAA